MPTCRRRCRRTVTSNADPDAAFDTAAYDKGELVLATFERAAGADAFRAAVRAYLHDHRGGSVTIADFSRALATATSPALADAFAGAVDHAGVAVVEVDCTKQPVVAHARDHLVVPVAGQLVGEHAELSACPALAPGDYAVVVGVPRPPKLSAAQRIAIGADVAAAVRRGELAAVDALVELRTFAGAEPAAATRCRRDRARGRSARRGMAIARRGRGGWRRASRLGSARTPCSRKIRSRSSSPARSSR